VARAEPNGEEAGAAMAVSLGSAEKKKGKEGRGEEVSTGCTTWREDVGARPGTACRVAEGGPQRQQPARAAGAGSGQAAWEAGEWGDGDWQVGRLGGWGPAPEREEKGREEERMLTRGPAGFKKV
jgi:hypothetical protein